MNTQSVRDGARRDVAADITAKILRELERAFCPGASRGTARAPALRCRAAPPAKPIEASTSSSFGAPRWSAATPRPIG